MAWADPEKSVLDVRDFHLRGRRYVFDKLDRKRLITYLKRYRNPRFVAFAKGLLELP